MNLSALVCLERTSSHLLLPGMDLGMLGNDDLRGTIARSVSS